MFGFGQSAMVPEHVNQPGMGLSPGAGAGRAAVPARAGVILVVDDTVSAREPLARLLRMAGYETECAGDGGEAMAAMERRRPDLVLLDLMMPRVDGVAFLREMRADPRFRGVPVMLVTAADAGELLSAARKVGVEDCLLKASFTVPELLERVGRVIKGN